MHLTVITKAKFYQILKPGWKITFSLRRRGEFSLPVVTTRGDVTGSDTTKTAAAEATAAWMASK